MISYPARFGGVGTRVLESGRSGTPIVLVHGTGGRADRWIRNLDALAGAGYHPYAFDLPGHGFADKGPGAECSVPAYRRLLGEFVDTLGDDKVVVVGTSLGGHVAASFACERPDRVQAVVLVGSMGLIPIGEEARGRIKAGANNQSRDGVATKFQRVIHDQSLVTQDMIEEEYRINNSPGAKESFAQLGEYIATKLDDDVVGPKLAELKIPTLLIWGDQDKTVALSVGEAARKLLPQSRLVVLSGAAHTPYYEKHDAFNRVLCDFLAGKLGSTSLAGVEYR